MDRKMKFLGLTMMLAGAVMTGCQGAKRVPDLDKIANLSVEKLQDKMRGFHREDLNSAWGEPYYDMFGDGELYLCEESGKSIVVFYEGDDHAVKYVRVYEDSGIMEFAGVVEEDHGVAAVVLVDDGYPILSSGNRVTVDLAEDDEIVDVEVGDHVYVKYIGAVMESYPLQLMDQISISKIDSAGAFEDVADALLDANTLEGVDMTLLDVTPISAKLQISNETDLDIQFGEDYNLQVLEDGEWKDVPYLIDNWAITAIAYNVPEDGTVEWDVNWETFHGKLEPGTYRIVKSVMDFRGTGDYTNYYYNVEFEIMEE